jgi:hypothetical protein
LGQQIYCLFRWYHPIGSYRYIFILL